MQYCCNYKKSLRKTCDNSEIWFKTRVIGFNCGVTPSQMRTTSAKLSKRQGYPRWQLSKWTWASCREPSDRLYRCKFIFKLNQALFYDIMSFSNAWFMKIIPQIWSSFNKHWTEKVVTPNHAYVPPQCSVQKKVYRFDMFTISTFVSQVVVFIIFVFPCYRFKRT